MITVEQLRANYPNPTHFTPKEGCYCVGGALTLEYLANNPQFSNLVTNPNFPGRYDLAVVLRYENTNMNEEQAYHFAKQIISYNEQDAFELAWDTLDKALKYMSFKGA